MSGERATFSPFWHRVRQMRPRLRAHVQITRQRYRGRIWHVAHDPASNQFYRLNPVAHDLVCTLDGSRTVEDAWNISLAKFADGAPTQHEVIQLLSQLYNSNLLSIDATPETEQLLRRGRDRLKKKVQQQLVGIMYLKIRVFNPDRILTWLEPLFRPVLSVWGFLLWLAFCLYSLVQLIPHAETLTNQFDESTFLAPSNWGWIFVVFVVTKAWHELGHGLICKRFGGQVPEFGFMLLVFFPSPYVDASACWGFANKWRRVAVGAGGMMFELFAASIAANVWVNATGDPVLRQIAYNCLVTASVSTVLFNANPLMRFDGYYILADLLETPNLMQRSAQMLKYLLQKYVFRLDNPVSPTTLPGERVILVTYGILSSAYRIFLFLGITLYVLGKFFVIGLILALWTASAWFIVPVASLAHWLATSPALGDKRGRTLALTLAMIGLAAALIGLVPLPDWRRAWGVVESVNASGVYFGTDGFIVAAHAGPGDRVREGDPIVTLDSKDLLVGRETTLAEIREIDVGLREAVAKGEPAAAIVYESQLRTKLDALKEIEARLEKCVVRAPHDGVVVRGDPSRIIGAYARLGEQLCEVVDDRNIRVVVNVDQQSASVPFELARADYSVAMRLVSGVWKPLAGGEVTPISAAQHQLRHAAMGYAGGGTIETEAADQSGLSAKRGQIVVYVAFDPETPPDAWTGAPGERVRLRFSLPPKPLLLQVIDRVQKVLQGKVVL